MLALPRPNGILVVGATLEHRNDTLTSLKAAFLVGRADRPPVDVARRLRARGRRAPADRVHAPARSGNLVDVTRRAAARPACRTTRSRGSAETLNEMLARLEDGLERERRFVADASHELRTPLATLRAELELALRRSRTTQEFENSIRSAAEETDRLSRIADDLLILARAERGHARAAPEPTDLVDVVERFAIGSAREPSSRAAR